MTGVRTGQSNWLRGLLARASARALAVFVVPDVGVARAAGLDLASAGLHSVATPRHARVLLLVGEMPDDLERAAAVAYAQMPRPRSILSVGAREPRQLPAPDVTAPFSQAGLEAAVLDLRRLIAGRSFSPDAVNFDVDALWTETEYVCPMHPEIVRPEPGSCPICGMDLVPREVVPGATRNEPAGAGHEMMASMPEVAGESDYTCPMHPEIVQNEPGSCPICGMTLVPRQTTGSEEDEPPEPRIEDTQQTSHDMHATGDTDNQTYTCPMHPEIVRSAPGSCPICGMDLVPQQETGDPENLETPAMDHTEHTGMADHDGHNMDRADSDEDHDMGGNAAEMDHSSHAMMDHSGHGGGGFMSMIAMTEGLPRSSDGLPMEWAEAPFGPLFSGLPGGLMLTLTLDGDTVARAQTASGTALRSLAATWPGDVHTFPARLANLDLLAPGAYEVLAWQAVQGSTGHAPDEESQRGRVGALERTRAISHLGWLAAFAGLLGYQWLANEAGTLQLSLVRATDVSAIAALRDGAQRLVERTNRNPMLRRRLAGIGVVTSEISDLIGPVARAAGQRVDSRMHDPVYQQLGFQPVTRSGSDALARLEVRLAELPQSLDLIHSVGTFTLATPHAAPGDAPETTATLELPRGRATAHVILDNGTVQTVHVTTPSSAHLGLVSHVAEGAELADALVGIASLDISPWEIDQ